MVGRRPLVPRRASEEANRYAAYSTIIKGSTALHCAADATTAADWLGYTGHQTDQRVNELTAFDAYLLNACRLLC